MKIKMLTMMAGPDISAKRGEVIEVLDSVGSQLVAGGYALSLDKQIIETAEINLPENTALPMKKTKASKPK